MKQWLIGLFVILSLHGYGQTQRATFSSIDWTMQNTEAPSPDSLARIITRLYSSELEKARAVYTWITTHIAYNTGIYRPGGVAVQYPFDPMDTASVWPSGDEMTARKVMLRRAAVCDGYSKLFKVLCDYVGVEAAIVQGYGRTNAAGDRKFRTNHSWNAVRIDNSWHLLDVTWAAGYMDWRDEFIANRNDFYFMTPPEQFIHDHYPEELRWTLLRQPPTLAEFRKMPFRSKNFSKYDIASYFPLNGIVEASVGDTLSFSLQLKDVERAKKTGSDPFVDTTVFSTWPLSSFVKPFREKNAEVHYTYLVEPGIEWVHLLYNDDVVLRYRIKQAEITTKKW